MAVVLVATYPFLEAAPLAAAGLALFGAGVARCDDVYRRHLDDDRSADAEKRRDIDHTRRLCYALLTEPHPKNEPLLIGTIANSLIHHHGVEEGPTGELVIDALYVISMHGQGRHANWLEGVLAKLEADA